MYSHETAATITATRPKPSRRVEAAVATPAVPEGQGLETSASRAFRGMFLFFFNLMTIILL